ncbi:MAG TPA: phosphoribosylformylglycinamidine synthase [Bacteroidia bacterium]|nr:phosphoribosylformylglycinamidine synthase [Bacteroidia bacterium]HRS59691.1 phosphoribosylformylglycinamidine synthase [Bacteroidia bacterium]HRU68611.1 phosphoribosylformylglycinamidine synthase [Bacteroidia bacterium]
MILFFKNPDLKFYIVEVKKDFGPSDIEKLKWLFGNAELIEVKTLEGKFIGPRKEMVTPWSTNAVEITQNMGIQGISRIEEFTLYSENKVFDRMLQQIYENPGQEVFKLSKEPEQVEFIFDIAAYNELEGLALSEEEIAYLNEVSKQIRRRLTDSEVYGFAQINSEHCRHKIFNGLFIIDGEEMPDSLFSMIKRTSHVNPNFIVSAYKDNVAFIEGPAAVQFAPQHPYQPDFFYLKDIQTVISLKAETHNFPTTVEPFNGAATGSGGEIRDRMAGGKGSLPVAGTAVYMTAYPRLAQERKWEFKTEPRKWLYYSPDEILIKASNGASDFGNKFGQPLICGSLLTFEHFENNRKFGYDKVIMLAGGIGYARKEDSYKGHPAKGDKIIVMGGDNYRIGMGGGAVSSVATGQFDNTIELNAVQRSNPEMQKRVANAIRALAEMDENPIISVHDHGAGGHLNSISELVEECGGKVDISKLPVGDPTLSARELIGNESQERMGLVIGEKDIEMAEKIAERERATFYIVGECTGDHHLLFANPKGKNPVDLDLAYLFGKPPKTVLEDITIESEYQAVSYHPEKLTDYIAQVLQIESVACKDWLTNKVDRSVTGKVVIQQCTGKLQLPLNDVAVAALDYIGKKGIATSIGHAPVAGLINPEAGSRLSTAEALTNLVWAPLTYGLKGVSLSANWMWPSRIEGENARLYKAVQAVSEFAVALGINIPTGKDSLSMVQKYPDGEKVISPGTVIISAVAEVDHFTKTVTPDLKKVENSSLIYIDFSKSEFSLGGSAFAQINNFIGNDTPDIIDIEYFKKAFDSIQQLIQNGWILAGHDVSSGGLITCMLEMCFSDNETGFTADLTHFAEKDIIRLLFSEKPAVVIQVEKTQEVTEFLGNNGISYLILGTSNSHNALHILSSETDISLDISEYRDIWYRTSYLFDRKQSGEQHALKRFQNYSKQELTFRFPEHFNGKNTDYQINPSRREKSGIKAAIIREKGVNGDREMAFMLYLAGFDVKDVHVTDLMSGREDLSEVNLIVFVGGFSNSDVLGSGKGWAGAFLYNERAKKALENFYKREDTLSLGICNGCQVMVELGLIYPEHSQHPKMRINDSGKFESAFLCVDILDNHSIMLKSLAGSRLGIWVAHGEGKFSLPEHEEKYHIPVKYTYHEYPGLPNGSDYAAAAICSADGRHLAMMPHLERAFYPHQWAYYPPDRKADEITPWIEAFVNAKKWIESR